MYTSKYTCIVALLPHVIGDILPGANHRLVARQYGYGYSGGFSFPPVPDASSTDPVTTVTSLSSLTALSSHTALSTISASGLNTGYPSGTILGPIDESATTSGPYSNTSLSSTPVPNGGYGTGINPGGPIIPILPTSPSNSGPPISYGPLPTGAINPSGTAPGTISQVATTGILYGNLTTSPFETIRSTAFVTAYTDPSSSIPSISGSPSSINSNSSGFSAPSASASSIPYGTISGSPPSTPNGTYPLFPYPTHGPYPLSASGRSPNPSGTAGASISQVASTRNFSSTFPTGPSGSGSVFPTGGYHPISSVISRSVNITIGTAVSTSPDPSDRPLPSSNATSFTFKYGPASIPSGTGPSQSPSISNNATTGSPPYGTAPILSGTDPSGSPTPSANASSLTVPRHGYGPIIPTAAPSLSPFPSANASSFTLPYATSPPSAPTDPSATLFPSSNATTFSFVYGRPPPTPSGSTPDPSTNASSVSIPYGTDPVTSIVDPSATPSPSSNATSHPSSSNIATSFAFHYGRGTTATPIIDPPASFPSASATSISPPYGTGPISSIADPSGSHTSFTIITDIFPTNAGTVDPSTISAVATTLGSTLVSTASSQPTEWNYNRRPQSPKKPSNGSSDGGSSYNWAYE